MLRQSFSWTRRIAQGSHQYRCGNKNDPVQKGMNCEYKCATFLQLQWRSNSSSATRHQQRPQSPYSILRLRTSATKDDIKASFRRLAKEHHPDLNPTATDAQDKMSELIAAYDQLMDDDFGGRVGDSRVALACEVYTIDELRMDRLHNVYTIQIIYEDESDTTRSTSRTDTCTTDSKCTHYSYELSTTPILQIYAHPDDSVSDLKRRLQSEYKQEWGLDNRRLDRDQLATGWELVNGTDGALLSYHLFLHSYAIRHRDMVYAVVRVNNTEE